MFQIVSSYLDRDQDKDQDFPYRAGAVSNCVASGLAEFVPRPVWPNGLACVTDNARKYGARRSIFSAPSVCAVSLSFWI